MNGEVTTIKERTVKRRVVYISELKIREADRLEITILVDNYTDILITESTDICRRPLLPLPHILLAEHGLSCLIKVCAGAE